LWVAHFSWGAVLSDVTVSTRGVLETKEFEGYSPLGVVVVVRVGGGGVVEWVFRRGRGVDLDPKVRVRFPTVVV